MVSKIYSIILYIYKTDLIIEEGNEQRDEEIQDIFLSKADAQLHDITQERALG